MARPYSLHPTYREELRDADRRCNSFTPPIRTRLIVPSHPPRDRLHSVTSTNSPALESLVSGELAGDNPANRQLRKCLQNNDGSRQPDISPYFPLAAAARVLP